MSPPNLFDFATSELSQDAFLCWLIAWADPSLADADATLHRTGRALLSQLLAKHGLELPGSAASATSAASVKVSRQFEHIDVLATIGETIVLAIEDKTDTVNHSQQLDRYRDVVEEHFPDRQHALIYLKTRDQSSYRAVEAKGWRVFDRTDLLAVLRPACAQTTNAILVDFLDHLEEIERQVQAFATVPPSDWDAMAWKGFFLQRHLRLRDRPPPRQPPAPSQTRSSHQHINHRLLSLERVAHNCAIASRTVERIVRPTVDDDQRAPALRWGDPRTMALLSAICSFMAAPEGFRNKSLRPLVAALFDPGPGGYTAARMTYDLRRLRLKGFIERVPRTHRYVLTPLGRRAAFFFTKTYARVVRNAMERTDPRPPDDADHPLRIAWRRCDKEIDGLISEARIAA